MARVDLARRLRLPGLPLPLVLLLVLVAVNGVAVWGILSARASARRAAREELLLQTTAHARSLEAVLASLRGDFIFLSRSPPVNDYLSAFESGDPLVRRWGRLDVEGTLLLFLQAHPPVERIVVRDSLGSSRVVVGRREGAPVVLPPRGTGLAPDRRSQIFGCTWPLGAPGEEAGMAEAWVDPTGLLAIAAPGLEGRLAIERPGVAPGAETDGRLELRVPVADEGWTPAVSWELVRAEEESEVLASVETLAGRYRTTVLLNLAVITLTLVLGTLALRGARRAARLEAEAAQQVRVRDLERQLMHSERLASVGRLAAGLAHEINNPLEGMSNYLSLLQEDLAAGRTEDAPRLVSRVRDGVDRAAAIIRRVLTFSDPGRVPKEELDLGGVLAEAVEFVRTNPAYRGVEVRLEVPDEGVPVYGNSITLGQLFLNLLLNACQAQPDGGEVEVVARLQGDEAVVAVRDRGPGLSEEVLERLFEPFFSTRGSTGLGLAVCHGIAADHGGAITGGNRPSGGADLTVSLPLAEASPAAPGEPEAQPGKRRRGSRTAPGAAPAEAGWGPSPDGRAGTPAEGGPRGAPPALGVAAGLPAGSTREEGR